MTQDSGTQGVPFNLPLESRHSLDQLRDELGLPTYVDTAEASVGKAIAVLWAARREDSQTQPAQARRPLMLSVFGGVAARFLCLNSNTGAPLARPIGDVDLLTSRKDAKAVLRTMVGLGDRLGSRYWHGLTSSDAMFNNLRGGRRYRLHSVVETPGANGPLALKPVDLFVDRIEFCHQVRLEHVHEDAPNRRFTIGAAELLLTKLQYIRGVDEGLVTDADAHRVIGRLSKKVVLVGPEDKDLVDVCAVLVDCPPGAPVGGLDLAAFATHLRNDWRLAKTVRLNLDNEAGVLNVLEGRVVEGALVDRARHTLNALREFVEGVAYRPRKPRFNLGRTWWEAVEDV